MTRNTDTAGLQLVQLYADKAGRPMAAPTAVIMKSGIKTGLLRGRFLLIILLSLHWDITEVDVNRRVNGIEHFVFIARCGNDDVVFAHGEVFKPEITVLVG